MSDVREISDAPDRQRGSPGVLGAILLVLLLLVLMVLILPLLIVGVVCQVLFGLLLLVLVWCWWLPRGRTVLFVHSNSPVWQEYLAEHVLSRLDRRAVVLNWSERSQWRPTLTVVAFWYFGGSREFNPLALVFRPFRLPRLFRFYEPFREFKHGKPEAVEKMTREFLDCSLGRNTGTSGPVRQAGPT